MLEVYRIVENITCGSLIFWKPLESNKDGPEFRRMNPTSVAVNRHCKTSMCLLPERYEKVVSERVHFFRIK